MQRKQELKYNTSIRHVNIKKFNQKRIEYYKKNLKYIIDYRFRVFIYASKSLYQHCFYQILGSEELCKEYCISRKLTKRGLLSSYDSFFKNIHNAFIQSIEEHKITQCKQIVDFNDIDVIYKKAQIIRECCLAILRFNPLHKMINKDIYNYFNNELNLSKFDNFFKNINTKYSDVCKKKTPNIVKDTPIDAVVYDKRNALKELAKKIQNSAQKKNVNIDAKYDTFLKQKHYINYFKKPLKSQKTQNKPIQETICNKTPEQKEADKIFNDIVKKVQSKIIIDDFHGTPKRKEVWEYYNKK